MRKEISLRAFVRKFFVLRFKKSPESDKLYFEEWVGRFYGGHPEKFMDAKSRMVYYDLRLKYEVV